MRIKITASGKMQLRDREKRVLDVTTTIAGGGIPSLYQQQNPKTTGGYWFREGDTFEMVSSSNNHKYFVREEDETSIVLEYHYRYDSDGRKNRMISELIAEYFHFVELIP